MLAQVDHPYTGMKMGIKNFSLSRRNVVGILLAFAVGGVGLFLWVFLSEITAFFEISVSWLAARSTGLLPNISPKTVCAVLILTLGVEAFLIYKTWRASKCTDQPTRIQKYTGYALILIGIPIIVVSLAIHIDGRLSAFNIPTSPFPG